MNPPQHGDALATVRLPKSPYRASWFNQFAAMMRRASLELIRDPLLLAVKLLQSLVGARARRGEARRGVSKMYEVLYRPHKGLAIYISIN